jgi:transcription elongation factor GreA
VDSRLSKLKFRLAELSMVDLSKLPRDRVGLGSRVVVLDVKKDEEISYKLVASEESDVANGLISTSSPIGKGLLGKKVGDEVTIAIPGGQRTLEVLQLKTIHDDVE